MTFTLFQAKTWEVTKSLGSYWNYKKQAISEHFHIKKTGEKNSKNKNQKIIWIFHRNMKHDYSMGILSCFLQLILREYYPLQIYSESIYFLENESIELELKVLIA